MADFDKTEFTQRIAKAYVGKLREHLGKVKFVHDQSGSFEHAKKIPSTRVVTGYSEWYLNLTIDQYMKADGSLREDVILPLFVDALVTPVVTTVMADLNPNPKEGEEDRINSLRMIGAGELIIFHRRPVVRRLPDGAAAGKTPPAFVVEENVELMGDAWFNSNELTSAFIAKADWALLRSGEIKKEVIDITAPPND